MDTGIVGRETEELVFAPGAPDDVKEQTIGQVTATPRHVLFSTRRHFIAYPGEEALASITCPLLYVRGSFPANLDRLWVLCSQREVAPGARSPTPAVSDM